MTQLEIYGYVQGYLSKQAEYPEIAGVPPPAGGGMAAPPMAGVPAPMKSMAPAPGAAAGMPGMPAQNGGGDDARRERLERMSARKQITMSEQAELERLNSQMMLHNPV